MENDKFTLADLNRCADILKRNSLNFDDGELYYGYNPDSDQFEVMNKSQLKNIRPDLTDEYLDNIPDGIPF